MKILLKRENQHSNVRIAEAVDRFRNAAIKTRRKITPNDDVSVTWKPLLMGKATFGRASNKHIPLHEVELLLNGVRTMVEIEKMKCSKLMK